MQPQVPDSEASTPTPALPPRRFYTTAARLLEVDPKQLLKIASIILLVLWCVWWAVSLQKGTLVGYESRGWFGPYFGIDYTRNTDGPTRIWLAGNDPYEDKDLLFCYPPPVLRMFAWCGWFTPEQSLRIWIVGIGMIAAAGAWAAWRCRQKLQLSEIPMTTAVAAILFSTPVVFAMERANYDMLVLLFLLIGIACWRSNSLWAQLAAGAVLALAPWAKLYPGLIGLGLLGLHRGKTLAAFVIVGLAIGLSDIDEMRRFLTNNDIHIAKANYLSAIAPPTQVHAWNHSLTENWPRIWHNTPLWLLGKINGKLAGGTILATLLLWVTWHVHRCPDRNRFAYPYLLWVVALATFVPPIANDYTLMFLPLAAVALWDRRAPVLVHVSMLCLALWWQPLGLPINGRLLILFKLGGLVSVGIMLIEQLCEARMSPRRAPFFVP